MSANLCLIAWNEPIGTPNCSRCLAYSSVMSKIVCAVPTISSARHTVASSSASQRGRRRRVGVAEHAIALHPNPVERDVHEPATAVEGVERLGGGRRDRHEHRAHAVVAGLISYAGDHHELVDRVALDDEALRARQHGVVAVERDRRGDVGGVERSRLLGDREGARHLARRNVAEEMRPLLRRSGLAHCGNELRDGREQGTGGDDAAELLGEDRGFEHSEADPAVLLGDRERGPPELDHRRPQRGGARTVLDDRARERDRALVREHRVNRPAQLFLIGAELELHARLRYEVVQLGHQRTAIDLLHRGERKIGAHRERLRQLVSGDLRAANARSSSSVGTRAGSRGTTTATPISPITLSARGTIAIAATSGWVESTLSTSTGYTL